MSPAEPPRAEREVFGVIRSAPYTSGMGKMLTTLTVALVLFAASPGWAGPTDQLREYTDQVTKVLDDPSLPRQDRRAAVRKIAHEAFDISESAQRVLARHWQARTPAERDEFTQLFADLLERTYIARMDEYGGERIRYTGETVDGNFAAVRARIVTKSGTEVAVESRMNLSRRPLADLRHPHRERQPRGELSLAVRPDHPIELLRRAREAAQDQARRVFERVGPARPSLLRVAVSPAGSLTRRRNLLDFKA